MIRLLGAITGAALALASLLVLVGIPQFKAEPVEIARDVMTLPIPVAAVDDVQTPIADFPALEDYVGENLPVPLELTDNVQMEPFEEYPDSDTPVDPGFESESPDSDTPVDPGFERVSPASDPPVDLAFEFEEAFDTSGLAEATDPQNWYAFWSPFRSEIAATGFVEQLQRVTGLDYRVVKTKPGVYEVAFSYGDDTDIPMNLSQITAATGLEMPGN